MDRLTETNNCIGFMETYLNIDCEECQFKNTGECEEYKDECRAVSDFKRFVNDMYSKLKEYEDLEERGKLLKLPCAVGDTVYQHMIVGVDKDKRKAIYEVSEAKVFKFSLDSYTLCFWTETVDKIRYQNEVPLSAFGKTVFLTKEEAESALNNSQ